MVVLTSAHAPACEGVREPGRDMAGEEAAVSVRILLQALGSAGHGMGTVSAWAVHGKLALILSPRGDLAGCA